MHRYINKLILYRGGPAQLLNSLAEITSEFAEGNYCRHRLTDKAHILTNKLLMLASLYNFNDNIWNCYYAYILAFSENPFSLSLERRQFTAGSISKFMLNDMAVFIALRDYDFKPIEDALGITLFSTLKDYTAVEQDPDNYSNIINSKVLALSRHLASAQDKHALFGSVTEFYKNNGVGFFGLNKAFRIVSDSADTGGSINNVNGCLTAIANSQNINFDNLYGIDRQAETLKQNTQAFIDGKPANNCLLYGDSGTGKSSSIKALLNLYYPQGLRLIEIYKHEFSRLSQIIEFIRNRNYKFIIFMDDLSFEPEETEYKYLKAVIEGGPAAMPKNVLIYATSNRRHFIRELWRDRDDMSADELHRSDTLEEKLSLAARFGLSINYSKPDQERYFQTVFMLARQWGIFDSYGEERLRELATKWELSGAGYSGRSAAQFVRSLFKQPE